VSWNNVVRNVLSAGHGRPALVSLEEVQQALLAFQATAKRVKGEEKSTDYNVGKLS
jgi:hypothetical protein